MEIIQYEDIKQYIRSSVVTVGMFDGFHVGHRQLVAHLLHEAHLTGLAPVVVTFDRHPRSVVDSSYVPHLLSTSSERLSLLEASGVGRVVMVQFTPALASMSACTFARQLYARVGMRRLLLGYDNQFGSRVHNDFTQLPSLADEIGFTIVHDTAVYLQGIEVSSTKIRHALLSGDILLANAMLSTPYVLTGMVVHGRHVGTKLGFPTANVQLDVGKLVPCAGVYAAMATIAGTRYRAMVNLGPQPTFGLHQPVLEVHLVDYKGDLYGQQMRVEFFDRLRDIRQFDSPQQLAAQLESDRRHVAQIDMQ